MDDDFLKNFFKQAQKGEKEAMLKIIKKFNPLITKYAHKLGNEDGKSQLVLFVLELINNINLNNFYSEGHIVIYVTKSIKNEYIRLSKLNNRNYQQELLVDDLFDNQETEIVINDPMITVDNRILINMLLEDLSIKEKSIIYLFFIKDYSISEIAAKEKVSRQAINQIKNKALQKIKNKINLI